MRDNFEEYSILIVDDNPGDVILISEYIDQEIPTSIVTIAESYQQTRAILLNPEHHLDIILLDLTLPDFSGEALVKEVVDISREALVIVLTGYSNLEFGKKCLTLGASDYLLKDSLGPTVLYKSVIYSIERNEYTKQLKDSQKKYFDLFQLSPQPMWVYDEESLKFQFVNNASIKLYGYSNEEFMTMTVNDIIPNQDFFNTQMNGNTDSLHQTIHSKKNGEEIIVEEKSSIIEFDGRKARMVLATDITEKKKLQEKLQHNTYLVENRERQRISSALHDGLQQLILASSIRFDFLKNNLDRIGEDKFAKSFNDAVTILKEALDQTRTLAHTLVPVQIERKGIVMALNDLIRNNNTETIKFDFTENIGDEQLPINLQVMLYRIAQEGVNNIIKHSEASKVQFHLIRYNSSVCLKIADNGIGFDPSVLQKNSFGLQSIKERVESLAGSFNIVSELGKGSTIEIHLPLSLVSILADD